MAQGAYQDSDYTVDGVGAGWWWLRSPGIDSDFAAHVSFGGGVRSYGDLVSSGDHGVRPVVGVLP